MRTAGFGDAVLVILIVLTRFEGAIVLMAFGLLELRNFFAADAAGKRVILVRGACVLGCLPVFLLFKYRSYGTLLPHAFHLKQITKLYAPASVGAVERVAQQRPRLARAGRRWTVLLAAPFRHHRVGSVFGISAVSLCVGRTRIGHATRCTCCP